MSDRDCWATPKWLTDLLPTVDLDPCSNAQSTVKASTAYDLARGEDGLVLEWFGSVYVTLRLPFALMFRKRVQFVPPPGIKPSSNSKPQALLMDRTFLSMCSPELLATGVLWRVEAKEAA